LVALSSVLIKGLGSLHWGEDEGAKVVVARTTKIEDAVVEVVGHIPASTLAGWEGMFGLSFRAPR
jgi:hypothetical protein